MSTRYYCGNELLQPGREIRLPADESRHLLKVMRGRTGDEVIVFGGRDQFTARLQGTSDQGLAVLMVGEELPSPVPPSIEMTFLVPWIKGGKTEFLVQKLTELGACKIIAFHALREVVKGDDSKLERLRRVALEACKQCERADIPEVTLTKTLTDGIERSEDIPVGNRFFLHERLGDNLLGPLAAVSLKGCRKFFVASGPEGGWHPDEVKTIEGQMTVASLGPRILRAETAPLVAAAALLAVAGDI